MAEVSIQIAGRAYALTCRDGDEPRLHELARSIAMRVDKAKLATPGLTEVRQLLFAALLLADELSDAQADLKARVVPNPVADDGEAAQLLEGLAERLEAIGETLAGSVTTP
ncbi:MAG: cell division protein ZapA [Sphingobium sp.]